MPVYHSGNLSRTGRPDFNYPLRPMTPDLTKPLAPRNMMVTSPYKIGATDIRWDNPKLLPQNSGLHILGVNVYRSTENPYGPYELLTPNPVGVLFYRDETQDLTITEDLTATLKYSLEPDKRWLVYTNRKPIVQPGTNGKASDRVEDVRVEIDSGDGTFLVVPAFSVTGRTGEIQLISGPSYNYTVNQVLPARLPWPPTGRVRVTYTYTGNQVLSVLSQRIYYKVTTVAVDPSDPSKRIETPIDEVEWRSVSDLTEINFIWREAILRNRWILEQEGERVLIFTRKSMGPKCEDYEYSHGQSHNDCHNCYGTNFVNGFEGPFPIIIAPPEAEKSIELLDMGLHIRYNFETFTGPFPLINERDIIVRQSNERFVVGPVNPQGSQGAIYQQHFTIEYLDESDIRYKLSVTGAENVVPESTDAYREPLKSPASPIIPVKPTIPEERLIKGRSVSFENIQF